MPPMAPRRHPTPWRGATAALLAALLALTASTTAAQQASPRPAGATATQQAIPLPAGAAAAQAGEAGCTKLPTRDLTKATGPQTYLYVFAGPDRASPDNPDFLVTIDATGPTDSEEFGSILATTDIPSPFFGSEPHHVGVNGDILAAGGLFSYKTGAKIWPGQPKSAATPDAYFFNISKATAASPKFLDSTFGVKGAVTDSFLPLGTENGQPKFLASFMGNKQGGAPGKLAEIAYVDDEKKWEVVAEHEGGVGGEEDSSFTPHGFDRNGPNGTTIVTADYVRADSTWRPNIAFKWGTTVRVWDLPSRKVVAKWDLSTLPDIKVPPQGLMSVRWTGKANLFWFSAGTGSLYLVDASKRAADGISAAIKEVYTLKPEPVYGSCVFSGRFANNTRLLVTSLALNEVRLLDTTNPAKLETIQIYSLPKSQFGTPQPHVVVTDANGTIAAVTTYYVEQNPGTGLWRQWASKELILFSIAPNKNSFAPIKTVDFNTVFTNPICGGVSPARGKFARPHGAVFVTRS